jgi:hypothetical protein
VANTKQPAKFDPETVALLREAPKDAWASLRPDQRARVSRTLLAEGILKSAAEGERDPESLRDAALKVGLSSPLIKDVRTSASYSEFKYEVLDGNHESSQNAQAI